MEQKKLVTFDLTQLLLKISIKLQSTLGMASTVVMTMALKMDKVKFERDQEPYCVNILQPFPQLFFPSSGVNFIFKFWHSKSQKKVLKCQKTSALNAKIFLILNAKILHVLSKKIWCF